MQIRHDRVNYFEVAKRASHVAEMFRRHAADRTCTPYKRRYAEIMADQYDAISLINLEMAARTPRAESTACH